MTSMLRIKIYKISHITSCFSTSFLNHKSFAHQYIIMLFNVIMKMKLVAINKYAFNTENMVEKEQHKS